MSKDRNKHSHSQFGMAARKVLIMNFSDGSKHNVGSKDDVGIEVVVVITYTVVMVAMTIFEPTQML